MSFNISSTHLPNYPQGSDRNPPQAARLCRIFAQPGHSRRKRRPHSSITLVGNSPLNEARDRPAIAAADYVIRFNWMHQRWV